jgi:hypothetical protein
MPCTIRKNKNYSQNLQSIFSACPSLSLGRRPLQSSSAPYGRRLGLEGAASSALDLIFGIIPRNPLRLQCQTWPRGPHEGSQTPSTSSRVRSHLPPPPPPCCRTRGHHTYDKEQPPAGLENLRRRRRFFFMAGHEGSIPIAPPLSIITHMSDNRCPQS